MGLSSKHPFLGIVLGRTCCVILPSELQGRRRQTPGLAGASVAHQQPAPGGPAFTASVLLSSARNGESLARLGKPLRSSFSNLAKSLRSDTPPAFLRRSKPRRLHRPMHPRDDRFAQRRKPPQQETALCYGAEVTHAEVVIRIFIRRGRPYSFALLRLCASPRNGGVFRPHGVSGRRTHKAAR